MRPNGTLKNKKTLFALNVAKRAYKAVLIIQSENALRVGAPYTERAGCCEVIEPDLSFTLDKTYSIILILPLFFRKVNVFYRK
jgi:hypothetical protein